MSENNIDDTIKEVEDVLDNEDNGDKESTMQNSNKNKPVPFVNPIPDKNDYLGHIVAQDTGLKVGRDHNLVFAAIHPDKLDDIEVGDYVRVPYYRPDKENDKNVTQQLLASVKSVSHSTALEDRHLTSADSFGSEQYMLIAELSPISQISFDSSESLEPNFVSRPPLPTVKIDSVNSNEFLRCGLEIPLDGIYVGDMSVNGTRVPSESNPLEYYLFNPNAENEQSGEPSIFRHVLVSGSTGTGKTHTSKNILRQFAKCEPYRIDIPADEQENENKSERERPLNITIIDPEDEYTELGEDPIDENLERAKKLASERKGLEYGAIGDETDFKIFAPCTGDSSTKELDTGSNEVIDFGIPFEIVKKHKELMMPDDPQGPTRHLIKDTINTYFRENGPHYSYSNFSQWFTQEYKDILEAKDKFSDSIVNAASRRITDRREYRAVFDKTSNDFVSDELNQKMFKSNQVSVITTGHLRGETQNLVIQAMSSYIVENKISSNPHSNLIKGTPLVLALDEAHEYVSEPQTTREISIVNKFRRAARRGRKDKFGLYFISQNPADIDGEVRNQINTKIYLQLDRRVVEESDVFVPPEFTSVLPQFDKGQMIVVQPDVQPVEIMGLDTCLTKHSK